MAEHIYSPHDRPDVEVLVDGAWYPGELRGWWDRDGVRLANVSWRSQPGMSWIRTLPVDHVRPVADV